MSYQLTIEPLGQTIEVEEGQTLLDASLRAGIYLPHACCHGLCATCKVQVIDGEVEHGEASNFALMDYEREEGKCLACCAVPQSDVVIDADVDVEPDARNLPVRDFAGTVTRVEALTPTIKGVWIALEDDLVFQAGQYINLKVPGETTPRPFSLANAPSRTREVELHVRLVPGGKATTWIHESLTPGERVELSGPYGRFFVRTSAAVPSLFLAGGSGLSSPLSMLRDLLESGSTLPITLVQGARSRAELYYVDELRRLAAEHPTFRYAPVISEEPPGSGVEEDATLARGFVHDTARELFGGDFRGYKAYLCGPPLMIEACITTLMRGRLFEKDIYTERFFSAADAQRARSPLFKKI
jgi:phenol/toluene 2-monooxygenase (NADH) P5/A5